VLAKGDGWTSALRTLVAKVMQMDEPRKWYSAMMSGLDVHYGAEGKHPLLGRRMPDLDIGTANGPTRLFNLLHQARPVLLNLDQTRPVAGIRQDGRVRLVDATFDGVCELPVIGVVPTPSAVLIRPDGHVAWVGEGSLDGLVEALQTWFGE
jgi:aromatic ring hydroxylase-like protein